MAIALSTACSLPALAACPIELATYADRDKAAEIEFMPAAPGATVTNGFKLLLGGGIVLDGFVQWTAGVSRPYGTLHYNCPTGDVTGDEYAACTVWQGVIYASTTDGNIGLMPQKGSDAPQRLVLADLGPSVAGFEGFGVKRPDKALWDVFELSGCQE